MPANSPLNSIPIPMKTTLLTLPLLACLAGPSLAQGDDCSNPMAVGLGTTNFDLSLYSDSGYYDGSCTSRDGFEDIWFLFTATSNDLHVFETCGGDIDTTLRIYDGAACGSVCIAGNDDACAMSNGNNWASKATAQLTAGNSYLIQVETWDSGVVGLSNLTVSSTPIAANDDCSTATQISDLGVWAYDTTIATTSGFTGASACSSGSFDMGPDVFFQWTAVASGDFEFSTEGSPYDTKMSVHAGVGCAGTCVGYNDDTYGNDAAWTITGASAGDTYLIQIGGWNSSFGQGQLEVKTPGSICTGLTDALESNDTKATATVIGNGTVTGLNVTDSVDLDLFTFVVKDGDTLTAIAAHNSAGCSNPDIDMFLYEDVVDPADYEDPATDPFNNGSQLTEAYSCSDNETLTWVNTTGSDITCVLRVAVWPTGNPNGCTDYDLTLSGIDDGAPTLFCDPASPNSSGNSVSLANSSFSGAGVFHIEAEGGPNLGFAMVVVSATANDPGTPISQGMLCLGSPLGRYSSNAGPGLNSIGRFDASGVMQNLAGTSSTGTGFDVPAALPTPPGGVISTGSTWNFQVWYRDGVNSNFSNGISVTF